MHAALTLFLIPWISIVYRMLNFIIILFVDQEKLSLAKLVECVITNGHVPRWELLGLYLGVEKSQLDIIEYDKGRQCVKCCIDVINFWLETDNDASETKFNDAIGKLTVASDGKGNILYSTYIFSYKVCVRICVYLIYI